MQTMRYLNIMFFFLAVNVAAQDTIYRKIPVNELFELVENNNQQLKISESFVRIASDRVGVAKNQRNPSITASANAYYIGDAYILDKDFANGTSVSVPHFGNSFSLQASQLVFKGGALNNSVDIAELQEQIARLNFSADKQDIKFLVLGYYFDLLKLDRQRDAYLENIKLAKIRLSNITKMSEQGMVTRNDVIRNELLITNLTTAVKQIDNSIAIKNRQLGLAAGLEENVYIVPEQDILGNIPATASLESYLSSAYENYPDLKTARINTEIAEKNIKIAKAEKLPSLSLFAGNSLTRPLTSVQPALDMYSNGWQVGVGLNYNVSSLFNANKTIRLAQQQKEQANQYMEQLRQNVELDVTTSLIRFREANQVTAAAEKSLELAQENLRIIDKKYANQLAILTEVMDAANARLEAELQKTNAEINILYAYYQIQRATGSLN